MVLERNEFYLYLIPIRFSFSNRFKSHKGCAVDKGFYIKLKSLHATFFI